MHVILNSKQLEEVDCFKYLGLQAAADLGCDRDVVHRMNEGYRAWLALKSVQSNKRTRDKGQEVSIWKSNCTNGIVWSRGMGYEKCWEKESECSWDEVFEKFGWCHEWIELGMKSCVGELE